MGAEGGSVRVSRRQVALAAVLLTVGVGACTGGEPEPDVTAPTFVESSSEPSEPGASVSASASAEPSGEPTVAAPVLPELATQQTPEGAVAFTQWWFETLNYATATGDVSALQASSSPSCEFCSNLASDIQSAYENGGRREGGATSIVVSPPGAVQNLGINLAVVVDLEAVTEVDASGNQTASFDAETDLPLTVSVLRNQDTWLMGAVAQ